MKKIVLIVITSFLLTFSGDLAAITCDEACRRKSQDCQSEGQDTETCLLLFLSCLEGCKGE